MNWIKASELSEEVGWYWCRINGKHTDPEDYMIGWWDGEDWWLGDERTAKSKLRRSAEFYLVPLPPM